MNDLEIMQDTVEEYNNPSEGYRTTYSFGGTPENPEKGSVACINTYVLQLSSLQLFAEALGYMYSPMNTADGGSYLYKGVNGNYKTERTFISSESMVKLHNNNFNLSKGLFENKSLEVLSEELGFNLDNMKNAIDSKLVKKVYFQVVQPDKLSINKFLRVQKHFIEYQLN